MLSSGHLSLTRQPGSFQYPEIETEGAATTVSTQPGLHTGDNQSNAIIVKHISPAFPVVEVMTARLPAVICVT